MVEQHTNSWHPMLQIKGTISAIEAAHTVATRLRERERVETAVMAMKRQTAYPRAAHWQPSGVAQGYAGLAIMCGYLAACFPDEDWDVTAHGYIELAARDAEQQTSLPTGLFSGLSGLAFAVWYLSQGGKRYRKLLSAIEQQLIPQTLALASNLSWLTGKVAVSHFDLISGLSGVGAYLLCRQGSPEATAALRAVLSSLTELASERPGLPLWYTPVQMLGDETMMTYYPYGNLNCGLAHGIPGPLGLLSLARISGIQIDGMEEAIAVVARWLLQHRMDDQWGINWPTAVRVEADGSVPTILRHGTTSPFEASRTAWCYGSPGLARTLWFAGEALDNSTYRESAVAAMEAVYRRPIHVRRIDSPTFCHGIAGIMHITLRFARDTGLPQFVEAAQALSEQLLALYDPDTLLGYFNLEPGDNHVDHPGLLDGAPGVVLVLLAATTSIEPAWDRLFLLS